MLLAFLILCSADLEDLFHLLGMEEEPAFPTVSGWVINQFGRSPDTGDSFPHKNLTAVVTKCGGPRVVEIKLTQNTAGVSENDN